jgi:fucose permease
LRFLALLCLLPVLVSLLLDFDVPRSTETANAVLRNEHVWFGALVFLLYAPLEFFVSTWTTTLLIDLGYRERRAAWLLSGFWLTFLAGRLGTALLLHRYGRLEQPWSAFFLFPLALGSAIVLSNIAGAADRMRAAFGFLLLGLLMGPIFPTLQGLIFTRLPNGNGWGTSFGLLFAVGSSSSLVLAPLAGAYARRNSLHAAFRLLAPLALVLACAALLFALQGESNFPGRR